MSFKPLHALIDQPPQPQSVALSGNRRIAPAIPKAGNSTVSVPVSSTASFKNNQKIQLGSQLINVSDLQGILKGGTNIVELSSVTSSQSSPQMRGKSATTQQGTYANRLMVKQQQQLQRQQVQQPVQQQQQLHQQSNVLSTIVVQNSPSTIDAASASTILEGAPNSSSSSFITEQKPFALQITDDAANQNSKISYVTVMDSEDGSSGANRLVSTANSQDEVLFQTDSNELVFQGAVTPSEPMNSTVVLDNTSSNQSFGQIIYQQNDATDSGRNQPLFVGGAGGAGGGGGGEEGFNMNVFDVNVLAEEIDGAEERSFQPNVSDQEATTTVLIPSSLPGGEPQRLVIPTSTLLQITGQSSNAVSHSTSSSSSSMNIQGSTGGVRGLASSIQSPLDVHQRLKPTSEQETAAGFLDNAASFIVSPSKNSSNIVLLPKPSNTTPNGRYVPITAAPIHSMESITSHDSFELNGSTSPLKDSTQRFTTSPVGPSVPPEPGPNRNRKPCNCTKSQCLKLYCDCFANGEFCFYCNCNNCMNNMENEEARQKSIKLCLDRNPYAFHPKIGKSKANGGETRRHAKGCNCKKSGCLKNYCECYEAKIPCTSHCKCVGCKNFDENDEEDRPAASVTTTTTTSTASSVATGTAGGNAVIVSRDSGPVQAIPASRFLPQVQKLSGPLDSVPSRPRPLAENGQRRPFSLISTEVVEATTECMLASSRQIESSRRRPLTTSSYHSTHFRRLDGDNENDDDGDDDLEAEMEAAVIEELGRCFKQIINTANKTPHGPVLSTLDTT